MYLCICNKISDKKLKEFLENEDNICSDHRVKDVYKELTGKTPSCGKCLNDFKQMLGDAKGEQQSSLKTTKMPIKQQTKTTSKKI